MIYTRKELLKNYNLTAGLLRRLIQDSKIRHISKNQYDVDDNYFKSFDKQQYLLCLKNIANKKRSKSLSAFQQSKTAEEKLFFSQKCSKAVAKVWSDYTEEEKQDRCRISKKAVSIAMKTFEAREHCRQGQLDWWSRAPKDWQADRTAKIKDTLQKIYTPEKRLQVGEERKLAYKKAGGAIQEKCNATKRKNGTFTTSKDEKRFLEELESLGLTLDKTVFKEKCYPKSHTRCDFYLPEFDLYVELQYAQYHMHEPFDKTSKEHAKIVENLLTRAKSLKRQKNQYYKMVEVWTQ